MLTTVIMAMTMAFHIQAYATHQPGANAVTSLAARSVDMLVNSHGALHRQAGALFRDLRQTGRQHIRRAYRSLSGRPQLSPYDHIVRKYAEEHQLDWVLVTAQIYQESRFDPRARSHAGARGLMQLMPRTAKQLGVTDLHDPESSIAGGVKYLAWLNERFRHVNHEDKIWFMLAAYNAGIGHVRDARRLAKKLGLRSDRWFGHVEKAMMLLSKPQYASKARYGYVRGHEPVKYVRAIKRYHAQYHAMMKVRS